MKWILLIVVLIVLAIVASWGWRKLNQKDMPDDRSQVTARQEEEVIEGLLRLLYCDVSLQEMRDVMGTSESIAAILDQLDADEHLKAEQAAEANLKMAREGGESRAILNAWHIIRELGGAPPREEADRVLGLIVETNSEDLSAITGAFSDGEARLYSLQGMGLIGEMSQYPKVAASARECVVEASKVAEQFEPTAIRPHPGAERIRITLLTPGGFRAFESPLEDIFDESHELADLFSDVMQLQRRLLRVYNKIEGTLEGALLDDDLELVNEHLKKGADPNGKTSNGVPLMVAAAHSPDAVSTLIRAGAQLDVLVSNEESGWNDMPLLALIAEAGLAETARRMIDAGAQVDFEGKSGRTALVASVGRGEFEAANVLLEKGADPNHRDADGRFPLLEATLNDDLEMIELLVAGGAHLELKGTDDKLTAFLVAAQQGQPATARALAAHGADIEARDGDSYSGLMNACNRGREEMVNVLLELGADVNAKDAQGSTPIMFAAQHGHTAVVRKLLQKNADPNVRGTHGFTALGLVMQHGHKDTIELLKSAGATE